jgi:hypothetical protein
MGRSDLDTLLLFAVLVLLVLIVVGVGVTPGGAF